MISREEQVLLTHLGKIRDEGIRAREEHSKNWDHTISVVKGDTWPKKRPSYMINASMNFLHQIIERKAALLTDNKPTINIMARRQGLDPVAEVLKKTVEAILDKENFEQKLLEHLFYEQYFGIGFWNTPWDKTANYGRGDILLQTIDPRSCGFDPMLHRAYSLSAGEYFFLETTEPTEKLKDEFPSRADDIKKDFGEFSLKEDSLLYKIRKTLNKLGGGTTSIDSVIPRSLRTEYWIKDRAKDEKGQRKWPTFRQITVVGGCIAQDGQNPYWDGGLPIEGMEWNFDIDSPYGTNEVSDLEMPQVIFNKVLASIVENAVLMGNGIWIGDINSITDEQKKKLNNGPGGQVWKRPGTELRRESGPPLPTYMLQLLTAIPGFMEKLGGLAEVLEGKKPGQVCVDSETECLTKSGWKHYWELLVGDMIYTFNPLSERGEWSPLLDLKVYDWDKELYSVETNQLSCRVTPNHGWLVSTANGCWASGEKYRRVETQDLNSTHVIPSKIRLDSKEAKSDLFSDAFVELVGWIVTEGCFSTTTRENGKPRYRVILSQSSTKNRENCAKISSCLYRCGLKDRSNMFGRVATRDGLVDWTIDGDIAKQLMDLFPFKRLTYEFVNQLTVSQLDILYETMLRGDGSREDGDVYSSSDVILSEQFQMVAILSGHPTHLRRSATVMGSKSGKHKKPWYDSYMYRVSSRSDEWTKWRTLLPQMSKVPYHGKVWCPQTVTGTWVARRNGVSYLTHNTAGAALDTLATLASTVLRLKARQLEGLLERIGQKLISRIFEFFSDERIFNLAGDDGNYQQWVFNRAAIIAAYPGDSIRNAFQDYTFKVQPGSSLSMTKWQKGLLAFQLFQAKAIDREALLDAVEYPNRKAILARTLRKQMSGEEPLGGGGKGQKISKQMLRGGRPEGAIQHPQMGGGK